MGEDIAIFNLKNIENKEQEIKGMKDERGINRELIRQWEKTS